MSVALITLAVLDLDRMAIFYEQALNCPPHRRGGSVEFVCAGLRLILFRPEIDAPAYAAAADGRWRLCLTTADLEGSLAALEGGGAHLEGAIRPEPHGRECLLRDPEGNPLILWETAAP
jgi:predicted enzyme related to lactoylglutathione lyase